MKSEKSSKPAKAAERHERARTGSRRRRLCGSCSPKHLFCIAGMSRSLSVLLRQGRPALAANRAMVAQAGFQRHLSTSSTLYVRGAGLFGALGTDADLKDEPVYTPVPALEGVKNFTKVSAGWGHSAAITEDGRAFVWGRCFDFNTLFRLNKMARFSSLFARFASRLSNNDWLGEADNSGLFPIPTELTGIAQLQDISCSAGCTTMLTKEGKVLGWGANKWLQCGTESGSLVHQYTPTEVPIPPCREIQTGLQHTLALTLDGEVYGWGKGERGQLAGHATPNVGRLPEPIPILTRHGQPVPIASISAGFNHSAALSAKGEVYVWGKQMSAVVKSTASDLIKMCDDEWTPRRLKLPEPAVEIVSSNFALIIRTQDNRLWAIGMGEHDRNMNNEPLPVTLDLPGQAPGEYVETLFHLPAGGQLRKGHQRVFVHAPGTVGYPDDRETYEIVIHKGEAYLLPWRGLAHLPEAMKTGDLNILDFSSGWQHDLLLVGKRHD